MVKSFLLNISSFFDKIQALWEGKSSLRIVSTVLVFCFIISSILSVLVINDVIHLGKFNNDFKNPFFSVEIVFTLLLITELLRLIFVLPQSVAKSVGKQFELLSLIFLRDGFKQFSHIDPAFTWSNIEESFIFMSIYGFGAIAVFTIIGFSHKLQKHIKLSQIEDDQEQFVYFKKLIGLFLLVAFAIVGYIDVTTFVFEGYYLHSFHTFFSILIFSDIVIVLVALRYTHNYYKIFRYSAFVLATILIRIALSVQPYYDVLIGVTAALFVLVLTLIYNYFLGLQPTKKEME
ncbi:MAG: hypothetical protein OEX22_02250 [Cyclobacteriaceae bacterium]|nr:hypothetical protein [Cyclobacteriaceae bacterium]